MHFAVRLKSPHVRSTLCLLFVVCAGIPFETRADTSPASTDEHRHEWVEEAQKHIGTLFKLARDTPQLGVPGPDGQMAWLQAAAPVLETVIANGRKGDELLWRLWLVSG